MNNKIIEVIKDDAIPLLDNDDLNSLIDMIDDEKYVPLGESSHGTSKFYQIRTEISKKLIVDKGFTFLAVEGDWPAGRKSTGMLRVILRNTRMPVEYWIPLTGGRHECGPMKN